MELAKMYNLVDKCYNSSSLNHNYVGIDYKEDDLKIYFPLGYEIPQTPKECQKSIFSLIKAINLVQKEKSDKGSNETNNSPKEIPLNSYIWLINDYLINGLYHATMKSYKTKINGKTNWKRTLKTKSYISNNNIVYLNPLKEKNTKEENIITMIELFCLRKSLEKVGFLFNKIILPEINISLHNKDSYLKILKTKILTCYLDHDKELFNNMIIILEEACSKNFAKKEYKYGTYHFNVVWQKMIDKVYGNIKSDTFFPSAKYHLNENEYITPKMLPDTILNYQNNLYIIDAKYYKYGLTESANDLPGTDSIAKQITYAKYADNIRDSLKLIRYNNVYNAFILPFNSIEETKLKYIGYAESGIETLNKSYENIAIILLDTKYLMDSYFKNQRDLDLLINNILKTKEE